MGKPPRPDEMPTNPYGLAFSIWRHSGSQWLLVFILLLVPMYTVLYMSIKTSVTVSVLSKLPNLIEWQGDADKRFHSTSNMIIEVNGRLDRIEKALKDRGIIFFRFNDTEISTANYETQ